MLRSKAFYNLHTPTKFRGEDESDKLNANPCVDTLSKLIYIYVGGKR